MIRSILTSVQKLLPKIITRYQSISKDSTFIESGSGKSLILKDSKDIAKARKQVKDALFINVDSFYSQLEGDDIRSISDNQASIVITSELFDELLSKLYTSIIPIFETFISEKKMAPSMAKLVIIFLSGLLIELYNDSESLNKAKSKK